VLRLLHLDELPQLINVARGEMDLIGPRPERPVFVARLARSIPNYCRRLEVLPGVTGLAQVNLPPDESLECVRRKLVLDCEYVRTAGLGLDLRILACTLLRMLGIRHGRAVRWLWLERAVHLPAEGHRGGEVFSYWSQQPPYQPAIDLFSIEPTNGVAVAAAATENGSSSHATHQTAAIAAILPVRRPR
jgi:hypothetical protein